MFILQLRFDLDICRRIPACDVACRGLLVGIYWQRSWQSLLMGGLQIGRLVV